MNSADPFEEIVSQHYEPLFRLAMSLTRSESDASDLTQQTFYAWATKGHQLRDHSKVKAWLFTTLHRAFLSGRRKQSRVIYDDLEEAAEQIPDVSLEPGRQTDCLQAVVAMSKVDKVYQAAVILFYLDDCSYKEIASILQIPVGTVKSRIARGIMELRAIIEPSNSHGPAVNEDSISTPPARGETFATTESTPIHAHR
ncbi:MAG: sigR [Verrucomicrobiales bacterium]|nr:sigR [Verrucomicrobiales bacterium]